MAEMGQDPKSCAGKDTGGRQFRIIGMRWEMGEESWGVWEFNVLLRSWTSLIGIHLR